MSFHPPELEAGAGVTEDTTPEASVAIAAGTVPGAAPGALAAAAARAHGHPAYLPAPGAGGAVAGT